MFTKQLNTARLVSGNPYDEWMIFEDFRIEAIVLANPEDGRAFKINFITDSISCCSDIIKFVRENEEKGGFKR